MITKMLSTFVFFIWLGIGSLISFSAPKENPATSPEQTITKLSVEDFRAQQYYDFNFGYWAVGATSFKDLYLTNDGAMPLYIQGVYVWGGSFYAIHRCPPKLDSGYRCLLRVFFQAWSPGYQEGEVVIDTNRGPISIYLSAWAY